MRLNHLLRALIRVPAFTALVVFTLALGIAANTAIFSVIEAVLLKPLPFPDPDRIVDIDHEAPGVNIPHAGSAAFLHFTYREDSRSFQTVGLWRPETFSVTGVGEPEEIRGLDVTEGVLPLLGVQPALGRFFTAKDDAPRGGETVVLAHSYWQTRFGGARNVLGRRLLLDGRPREVIGVLPAGFRFLDQTPSVIAPIRLDRSAPPTSHSPLPTPLGTWHFALGTVPPSSLALFPSRLSVCRSARSRDAPGSAQCEVLSARC